MPFVRRACCFGGFSRNSATLPLPFLPVIEVERYEGTSRCIIYFRQASRSASYSTLFFAMFVFDSAVLLQATRQRSPPLALLTACERAVELLGVGAVGVNGDVEVSPLPPLVEVAASGLFLGSSVAKTVGCSVDEFVAEEWNGVALVKSALVRREMGLNFAALAVIECNLLNVVSNQTSFFEGPYIAFRSNPLIFHTHLLPPLPHCLRKNASLSLCCLYPPLPRLAPIRRFSYCGIFTTGWSRAHGVHHRPPLV